MEYYILERRNKIFDLKIYLTPPVIIIRGKKYPLTI